jgi:hypothetical protein
VIETVLRERAQGARTLLPGGEPVFPPVARPAVLAAAATVLIAGLFGIRQWTRAERAAGEPIEWECDMSAERRAFAMVGSLFLTAACAAEPSAPPPLVSSAAVRPGSIRPGVWVYQTARWEDGLVRDLIGRDSFALERVLLDGREVWRSAGEKHYRAIPVISRDTVWMDDDLVPIRQVWYYQRGRTGRTVMDLSYRGGSVSGFFQDRTGSAEWRGDVRLVLPRPMVILPSYSLSGLAHVVASIPLSAGWSGTFQTVVRWRPPARTTLSLAMVGEERLSVPAGTFDCWRFRVVGTPDGQLWVSKGEQLLVKTSDGAKGYELETVLVSYRPTVE